MRRWPVAALAAFVIALTAVTATYYIRPVSPALPAVVSEGGTYNIPANTALFAEATGAGIEVTANATVYTYYTSSGFGFAAVVPRLPPNASVCFYAGAWCLANVTTPSGVYYALVHVVTDIDYNEYATCFKGVATRLDNGLYLIMPSGWGTPAAWQVEVCDVAAAASDYVTATGSRGRADFVFTGEISYDGTYIYVSNVDTGLRAYMDYLDTGKGSASSTSPLTLKPPGVAARTMYSARHGNLYLIAVPWHVIALVPPSPARVTVTAEPWP